MRTVVIYPGRFHPFHRGHLASYQTLVNRFGADNVFIATSDKQAPVTSPFDFGDKQHMMAKLGVPVSHVVKVKNPYKAEEILSNFDPDSTAVVFAVSEKDADRFSFAPKKDGTPSYMQPFPEKGRMQPFSKHGYILLTPTVPFKLSGSDASSATEIRNLYASGNDQKRDSIIAALYGDPDKNLRSIFDKKLVAAQQVQEFVNEMRHRPTKRGRAILERVLRLERDALNEDTESFILYLNGKPTGKFEDLGQAKRAAEYVQRRLPDVNIKIHREFCAIRPISLRENLREVLKEVISEATDYVNEA